MFEVDKFNADSIKAIHKAQKIINKSEAILITAGAGMGVDSGLPDFRGNQGLWKAYPPIKKLGYSFEQMESSSLFRNNPKLAWGFYGHRLDLYRSTKPHNGFKLLLDLVNSNNKDYFVFTSNVDGHFQKANFDKDKIYEVHGSVESLQCINGCNERIWYNNIKSIDVDINTFMISEIPRCEICSDVVIPNIVMFGNACNLINHRIFSQNEKFREWINSTKNKQLSIIEIGAGTTIPTIRNFDDSYSKKNENVTLIRINPIEFDIVNFGDIGIQGNALQVLEKILVP